MKTNAFKLFLFAIALVLNCAFVSAQGENNFIYDTKYENDVMVSKTVFEKEYDNSLRPKTMYEFKYDTLGRVAEKIAYKWDEKKGAWVNNFHMVCYYNDLSNTVEVSYTKWDEKTKKYDKDSKRQTYSIEDAQAILAKR